jgi:hypothetical protein
MQTDRTRWSSSRYDKLSLCIAAALTIVGARLWLISRYATSLPINDQWDGEGFTLLKPWFEGRLGLADLLSPHNEHRIFFSRLLTLGLTYSNGQWDCLLEIVFDAILCGVIAVLFLAVLLDSFNGRFRVTIALTITLWLTLPYAHENTFWGFQSSFYFLLLFSVVGIWGLLSHRTFSLAWFAGALGAVCACLSMGSGFFAPFVVAVILFLQLVLKERSLRDVATTLLLAGLILATGLHFQVTVPEHAILRAHSFSAWLTFFGRCLAWPFSPYPLLAVLVYGPFVSLFVLEVVVRSGKTKPPDRVVWLLIAIGLWVILQSAVLAYSRGAAGTGPIASRYLDILGLGLVINVLSLCFLWDRRRTAPKFWISQISGGLWLVAVLILAAVTSFHEIQGQYGRQGYLHAAEMAVRGYLATKDRHYLQGEPHPVPYADTNALVAFLDDKTIQSLLPSSVRAPLHVEKAATSEEGFMRPGCPPFIEAPSFETSWGSYSAEGAAGRGAIESWIIWPRLPYLEFEIAGKLGSDMSLAVEAAGRASQVWRTQHYYTSGSPRPQWRVGYAAMPGTQVRIVGRDNSTEKWFAFREPRELGRLSFYAERLSGRGEVIFVASIMLWGILLASRLVTYIRSIRTPGSASPGLSGA